MKTSELIAQYRWESGDDVAPYLNSDTDIVRLFNEATDQACSRKPLILDSTTASVCELSVVADTATYALHEKVVKVNKAYLVDENDAHIDLDILDRFELDRIKPTWREDAADEPKYIIVDEKSITLVPTPAATYTGKLEVQRLPLDEEDHYERLTVPVAADPEATPPVEASDPSPVIAAGHHDHLVHWVLARVYRKDDADQYAPGKADAHEAMFNRYFGLPPTSDRLRSGMTNRPHRNKVWR